MSLDISLLQHDLAIRAHCSQYEINSLNCSDSNKNIQAIYRYIYIYIQDSAYLSENKVYRCLLTYLL